MLISWCFGWFDTGLLLANVSLKIDKSGRPFSFIMPLAIRRIREECGFPFKHESNLGAKTLKTIIPLAAAFAMLLLPATALADTFTFTTSATAANSNSSNNNPNNSNYQGGSGQFDLDHTKAYTWKINNISVPAGQTILSASITFKNIANWDTNANRVFVHLLNTANNNGIASIVDNANDSSISAYFGGSNSLGPALGVDNIKLFERSFNMVGQGGYVAQNYTYNLDAAQLAKLAAFIASNNNIAFGFDPDCHYWNNGIVFTVVPGPWIPEPVSMVLLGTGLAGIYVSRRPREQA